MTLFANWAFWIQRRRVGTRLNTFCISMRFVYACVGWWLMCFCMIDFRLRALTWIFLFLTGSTQTTKSFCASEGAGSPTVYCMHEQVSEVCYQPRGGWQDGVLVWCMCLSASAWQLPISVSSCTFSPSLSFLVHYPSSFSPGQWDWDEVDQMDAVCVWAEGPVQLAALLQYAEATTSFPSTARGDSKYGTYSSWD